MQLGVLMDKWNNVRVWGRQSAFWEYLWCLAQHCPFLLLTASIHPQGQYTVLTAAMNQKRWEISSGSSHTEKCFDIMTHQDTKMFSQSASFVSLRQVCHNRTHVHNWSQTTEKNRPTEREKKSVQLFLLK